MKIMIFLYKEISNLLFKDILSLFDKIRLKVSFQWLCFFKKGNLTLLM